MKNIKLFEGLVKQAHKVGFGIRKHSPEILAVAGTIGVVASGIMACKATTKLDGILESAKNDIDTIHKCVEHPETLPEEYTKEDGKKDLTIVYAKTGVKVVKLYAPSVILGVLSLTSLLTSNGILRKRNVALAAAYTAVDKGFKEYRGRVVERFGEKLDQELRYNIKAKEIEETVIDESGEETTVKKVVEVADVRRNEIGSEYACFFDNGCIGWEKDAEYNKMYLINLQRQLTRRLELQRYLFLNDVYDVLGMPRTKAGQIVGWIYDESPEHNGDNYVDFKMFDVHNEQKRDFINGLERVILLDFNVDGPIINKLKH